MSGCKGLSVLFWCLGVSSLALVDANLAHTCEDRSSPSVFGFGPFDPLRYDLLDRYNNGIRSTGHQLEDVATMRSDDTVYS